MKKLIFLLMLSLSIGTATFAQKVEEKVKKTSTVPQKVHNIFSKHKRYNGYKTKHMKGDHKRKHKHTNKVDRIKSD